MRLTKSILILFFIFVTQSCGKQEEVDANAVNQENIKKQQTISAAYFSNTTSTFKVNVFYETGAEPYVGNLGLSANKTWDITKESFNSLINQERNKIIEVPTEIGSMTEVNDQEKSNWSYEELKELGNSLAPNYINNTDSNITVIFLNGVYNNSSSTLGVHLTGHSYSFIFKDVIKSVGGDSVSQKYIEQATIVHEMGHTIGLVNSGITMFSDHEDKDHPHHSTNNECVMYWAVESSNNILSLLADAITSNSLNLFKTESMKDAKNFNP